MNPLNLQSRSDWYFLVSELILDRVEVSVPWAIKISSWTWSLWYLHCPPPTSTRRRPQTAVRGPCTSHINTRRKKHTIALPLLICGESRVLPCARLDDGLLIEQLILPPLHRPGLSGGTHRSALKILLPWSSPRPKCVSWPCGGFYFDLRK